MKMAGTMFTRFVNIRNVMNINNFSATGSVLSVVQCSSILSKPYSTTEDMVSVNVQNNPSSRKMNRAMKAYLQQAKEYKEFIEKQIAEYDIGKRHLANMMGEDPNEFSDKDVQRSIKYLFPSGLYEPEARPMMSHPSELYAQRKEANFDESGRPYHFLFYTLKPNYYEVLHKIAGSLEHLNKMEDERIANMNLPTPEDKMNPDTSEWCSKKEIATKFLEDLTDAEYEYLLASFQRLMEHPLSKHAASFCMEYRKEIPTISTAIKLPEFQYDENNRPFVLIENCKRKRACGNVKIIGNGSGQITINGQDISYFADIYCREQIIFPLIFTEMSDKVDVEATVSGGGPTGQSGLIRWGISKGLQNFVSVEVIEQMRIAGLLTRDVRVRERKKYGQEGARRKFTWKKR